MFSCQFYETLHSIHRSSCAVVFCKKVFLKISQNLHVMLPLPESIIKKESPTQTLSGEFGKTRRTPFSIEYPRWLLVHLIEHPNTAVSDDTFYHFDLFVNSINDFVFNLLLLTFNNLSRFVCCFSSYFKYVTQQKDSFPSKHIPVQNH